MAGLHFRNASWSGMVAAVRAIAGLLSALLTIRLLGASQYGHVATWLSLFILYLSLNSSAFTMLVVKLMAIDGEAYRQRRAAATAAAFRFCLWSLLVLAAVTALLGTSAILLPFVTASLPKAFGEAILLMGVLTAIQILIALQAALIEGAGRLDLATKWQLAGPLLILVVLGISFFAGRTTGARAYLILLCAAGAIDLVLLWRVRRLLDLPLSPSVRARSGGGVLQLLRSGGLLQATSLLNLFLEPVNKFLLSHFAGPASVAIYDLVMKVVWGIQHLVGAAMRIFLHIGSQDNVTVGRSFARAIALLSVPVVSMHIAGALFLFLAARYWLAIDGTQLIIFFGIATISNLGMIFATPLYLSLIGRHDLVFVFRIQAVLASVNVAVSAATIPLLGLVGAAFGLLVATIFNVIAIYLRCRIDVGVYGDPDINMSQVKRRTLLAIALLVATISWAASGGGQPFVLATILAGLGLILVGDPLVARMTNQFAPVAYLTIMHGQQDQPNEFKDQQILKIAVYPSLRERLFPGIWGLLLPVRLYLKYFPLQRGKGTLLRYLVTPLLPPLEAEFELPLPGNATIKLRYRETLGLSSLLYGTFELAELEFVRRYLRPGDDVMDIGANVGIFSLLMGATLGGTGRLFAFEPAPENFVRLGKNLQRNGLDRTEVFNCALGEGDGQMTLHLATDPAYPSLLEVQSGLADGTGVPVRVRRLDSVWEEAGRPLIGFVKMDVEGAEAGVIRGAGRLIERCRPTMLIEANSPVELDALCALLSPYGYLTVQPTGFAPHNYIFHHPATSQGRLPT